MTQNWKQFIQQFPIANPSAKILVDLSHFGIIQVSGPDAGKFLHGQLTCDVMALESGDHTLGAYCNIQGKVDSLFRLWRLAEDYYLRMPEGLVEPTMQELQKYGLFSKVKMQIVSGHWAGFGVANNGINLNLGDPELIVLEIDQNHRYEIFGPIKSLEHAWLSCMKHSVHVDPEQWELLDIQDKLPELFPQTVGEFFPHDLNLPEICAVSFTKGCFRGQEIIARMQHRGKLKRHLLAFTASADEMKPGDKITAGGPEQEKIAGTVVRACRSKGAELVGLAVITDSLVSEKLYVGASKIFLSL